ncbi:hypothetical protein EPUS_09386 [Endocarpon pusillum Z07020]|uniref:Uncharacterized protein n=1 Tax=Endocarpon pusillum (strain Z07020 / HMAS-L-300199) TaxID=1263415 RepID=U1HUR2_ENDPU|nr:uncharacterized protein EPUS_09386 [Endocarpon pusillum Z07020]ERF74395.1 hypothetical protein EPUS_09386 [Endocarpon pusillum Z07020]
MGRDRSANSTKPANGPKANILLYLANRIAPDAILPHVTLGSNFNIRVIRKQRRPEVVKKESKSFPEVDIFTETRFAIWEDECGLLAQQSHQHARWADVLFVEMDADTISAMLAGLAYDTVLSILRCWDTSKRVVILPELSIDQWKSPIWKRQVTEIQSNWKWIQLLRPALWDMEDDGGIISESAADWVWDWQGPEEVVRAIQTEAQKITHSDHTNTLSTYTSTNDKFPSTKRNLRNKRSPTRPRSSLPPEIWTLIFEYLGDWEYATALGIYTTLPTPYEWLPHIPKSPSHPASLEYTLLTAPYSTIRTTLDNNSSAPSTLSPLAIKQERRAYDLHCYIL